MHDLIIKQSDNILIIAPHPDDECIGPGGILCYCPGQCSVVVLTDGSKGQGACDPKILRKIRREEFISEMNYLKIKDYYLLDYPDGELTKYRECLFSFNLKNYTKIFVTHKNDNHSDHTAAFYSLVEALRFQKVDNVEVYVYEIHNALPNPTHIFNITDNIQNKSRLMEFHRTQAKGNYIELLSVQAKCRALQNRLQNDYVEVYERVDVKKVGNENRFFLEISERNQKHEMFYSMLIKWLELNIKGNRISSYLEEKNIMDIVIYGYAEIGKLLYEELKESRINVSYVIDQKDIKSDVVNIRKPCKLYEQPDMVIVTAIYYYDEIKEHLSRVGYKRIESLSDIINTLYEDVKTGRGRHHE